MNISRQDAHDQITSRRISRQREDERTNDDDASAAQPSVTDALLDSEAQARHEASLVTYKRDPDRASSAINIGAVSPPTLKVAYVDKAASGRTYTRTWLPDIREDGAVDRDDQGKTKRRDLYSPSRWSTVSLLSPASRLLRLVRQDAKIRLALALMALLLLWVTWNGPAAAMIGAPTTPRAPGPSQKGMFAEIHSKRYESTSQVVASSDTTHRSNGQGMLLVNPGSHVHPITQLMEDAAKEWDAKVARQSKTLEEAITEYRRRNGRAPPLGFDKWWKYVCDNNVRLPDEYDQIHNDLLLFRALSPRDLRDRVAQTRKLPGTFVISVRDGQISTTPNFDPSTIHNSQTRIDQQIDLVKGVAADLPDFDAVYSIDDVPTQFIEYNHRIELIDHVDSQEGYFDSRAEWDYTYRGWQAGCSSSSPLGNASNRGHHRRGRPQDPKFFRPKPFTTAIDKKSFIKDHRAAMDPCQHPNLVPTHSAFTSKSPVVGPLMPVFSLSKTPMHADILGVPTEQVERNGELIPWEQRTQDKLLWRGRTTGPWHKLRVDWRNTQRTRLVKLGNGQGGGAVSDGGSDGAMIHMRPPTSVARLPTLHQAAVTEEMGKLNEHYMDMAFTEDVIQCSKTDGSCKALANEYKFGARMGVKEAAQYKYVIDVDGNAWSARFQRLISSGSVVFKSTVFPEWWTDRIQPWLHYVPVKVDYSDLYDSLVYFRGDLTGRGGHEQEAQAMAGRALDWSSTHMRPEDMTAYVFRLYIEWARLLADDRVAANLVYSPEMEVARKE